MQNGKLYLMPSNCGTSFLNVAFDKLRNMNVNKKVVRIGDHSLKYDTTTVADLYSSYLPGPNFVRSEGWGRPTNLADL
jgi:hypothetical protein